MACLCHLQYTCISALATVIGVSIRSIYPKTNGGLQVEDCTTILFLSSPRLNMGCGIRTSRYVSNSNHIFGDSHGETWSFTSELWMPSHYVHTVSEQPDEGKQKYLSCLIVMAMVAMMTVMISVEVNEDSREITVHRWQVLKSPRRSMEETVGSVKNIYKNIVESMVQHISARFTFFATDHVLAACKVFSPSLW